jgi:hypothetical protein
VLRSGLVLVTGGRNAAGAVVKTCDLYDEVAGTWAATSAMGIERERHVAVLLADGRVLVAGGKNAVNVSVVTAEIYDPATGLWAATGSLAAARFDHAGTRLPDGRALISAGQNDAFALLTSVEAWSPSTGLWTAAGSINTGRSVHASVLLPSGKVLIVGNRTAGVLNEVYDPAVLAAVNLAAMLTARGGYVAAPLPSGKVLVVAGIDAGFNALIECEELTLDTPALTTTSGVASATALGTGFYRLTLTAAARASWVAGGRHLYAEPASYAQPYDRSAQIQKAQVVRTDLTAGTIDVFVATNPVGINAAALPFAFWMR